VELLFNRNKASQRQAPYLVVRKSKEPSIQHIKRCNKQHKPFEETKIHLEGVKLLTTATEPAALLPERSGLLGSFLPYGTISSADSANSASMPVSFWTYISLIIQ